MPSAPARALCARPRESIPRPFSPSRRRLVWQCCVYVCMLHEYEIKKLLFGFGKTTLRSSPSLNPHPYCTCTAQPFLAIHCWMMASSRDAAGLWGYFTILHHIGQYRFRSTVQQTPAECMVVAQLNTIRAQHCLASQVDWGRHRRAACWWFSRRLRLSQLR